MRKEKGKTGRENRRQEKKKEDVAPSEIISVKQGHCVVGRGRGQYSGSPAGPGVFQGVKENGPWLKMKIPITSRR